MNNKDNLFLNDLVKMVNKYNRYDEMDVMGGNIFKNLVNMLKSVPELLQSEANKFLSGLPARTINSVKKCVENVIMKGLERGIIKKEKTEGAGCCGGMMVKDLKKIVKKYEMDNVSGGVIPVAAIISFFLPLIIDMLSQIGVKLTKEAMPYVKNAIKDCSTGALKGFVSGSGQMKKNKWLDFTKTLKNNEIKMYNGVKYTRLNGKIKKL